MTSKKGEQMKERPILMSAPMVCAILARRKTQTRRLMKPKPFWVNLGDGHPNPMPNCPYGVVGDRLWAREAFRYEGWDMDGSVQVTYAADGEASRIRNVECLVDDFDVWAERQCDRFRRSGAIENDDGDRIVMPDGVRPPLTPSIHMPRWASRITLTITDVRVQRVQDITAEDAVAEGARRFDDIPDPHPYGDGPRWSVGSPTSTTQCLGSARMAFANLFTKVCGPDAWDANPWVWAIAFEVVK